MATRGVIADKDFGRIVLRTRRGARGVTMRVKPDGLYVTVPFMSRTDEAMKVVEQYRAKLLESYRKVKPAEMDADFRIDAPCFRLSLRQGASRNFMLRRTDDGAVIFYPSGADFSDSRVQQLLKAGVLRALKVAAADFLPPLLDEWSQRYNLPYNKVKINGARTRWGSCSAARTINLSCYLMLLPPHLMDYVLLHELTHTREMNHGPKFWALLDSMTGGPGTAKSFRAELRNFSIGF